MLKIHYTKHFEKDFKKAKQFKIKIEKLKEAISLLVNEAQLPEKYKDHKLTGNYKNRRECHIEPDWLLIYKVENDQIIFERIGSHSELFK